MSDESVVNGKAKAVDLATTFEWPFEGRIAVVDNASDLPHQPLFKKLLVEPHFSFLIFDPANYCHHNGEPIALLQEVDHCEIVPGALLGDGEPKILYHCEDNSRSATLEPLTAATAPPTLAASHKVVAQQPVASIALDAIPDLGAVDLLLLDARHDMLAVLNNATQTLPQLLMVSVPLVFEASYQQQTLLEDVFPWMLAQGFQCYQFNQIDHRSDLPTVEGFDYLRDRGTKLDQARVLFIPNKARLERLTNEARARLAFLLETVGHVYDLSSALLTKVDPQLGEAYLISRGFLTRPEPPVTRLTITPDNNPMPWALAVEQDQQHQLTGGVNVTN